MYFPVILDDIKRVIVLDAQDPGVMLADVGGLYMCVGPRVRQQTKPPHCAHARALALQRLPLRRQAPLLSLVARMQQLARGLNTSLRANSC